MTVADPASPSEGTPEAGVLLGDSAAPSAGGDTKPEGDGVLLGDGDAAKVEPQGKPETTDDAKRAPEAYELAAADGVDLDAFQTFAREQDLTQDQAAAILQAQTDAMTAAIQAKQAAEVEAWNKEVAGWKDAIRKEWGGDFEANRVAGNRVLTKYDQGGELAQALKIGGWHSFPPLVRLLAAIGKDLGEDTTPRSAQPAVAKSFHERLFAQS